MKYLIIGAGPAGLTAAKTIKQRDPRGTITILSREAIPPYGRIALPELLKRNAPAEAVYLPVPAGIELMLNREAARLDPVKQIVETSAGDQFPYDRLLIATGSRPVRPEFAGGDLPFVFTVRDISDLYGIRAVLGGEGGKRVVIAGGGAVGLEMADALQELGHRLTIVVSSHHLLSTILDERAAALVELKIASLGIEVLKGEDIERIGPDGEVKLRSGETREADLVILGKGVRPETGFLGGSDLLVRQGIVVNRHQQTNLENVYAAGDIAETGDLTAFGSRVNAVWPEAVEQGRVAALNMTGHTTAGQGSLMRNLISIFGLTIFSAGSAKSQEGRTLLEEGPGSYRKLSIQDGVLKGAILVGKTGGEGLIINLMIKQADVSSFAESLLQGSYGPGKHLRRLTGTF